MYSETADSRKHLTVQGGNTRIIYEICSKLSIKTTDIIDIILLSILLTLNIIHTIFLVLLLLTLSMYLLDEITVYIPFQITGNLYRIDFVSHTRPQASLSIGTTRKLVSSFYTTL